MKKMLLVRTKPELLRVANVIWRELETNYGECAVALHGMFITTCSTWNTMDVVELVKQYQAKTGIEAQIEMGTNAEGMHFVAVCTRCNHSVNADGLSFIWDFVNLADIAWGVENYVGVTKEVGIDVK